MNWQKQHQEAILEPSKLLEILNHSNNALIPSIKATQQFALRAPKSFISRINSKNENDPLLRQIFPANEEEILAAGYSNDPVGDLESEKIPGLLHKYQGRVLLIVTGACAIHCRYCFRRHFPYAESSLTSSQTESSLSYIRSDNSIKEVILSGGDPFTLTDTKLSELTHKLEEIEHLQRLRIHTRTPIVLPDRILQADLSWLTQTRLKPIIVLHINHANEIDENAANSIQRLEDLHIPLFNQSVLLNGVNDSVSTITELSEALFEHGITPYYLHMLDPVSGTKHFEVSEEKAKNIMKGVRARLPGYLVPTLVREVRGELSKIPL